MNTEFAVSACKGASYVSVCNFEKRQRRKTLKDLCLQINVAAAMMLRVMERFEEEHETEIYDRIDDALG